MSRTRILMHYGKDELKKSTSDSYKSDLIKINNYLKRLTTLGPGRKTLAEMPSDFASFLEMLEMSEEQYIHAIRLGLKGPKVYLRRHPRDIMINNYNVFISSLNKSNMDIQFILEPYGCIVYMVSYINKASGKSSRAMRRLQEQYKNKSDPIKTVMKECMKVLLNSIEIGAPEAAQHCLGGKFVLSNWSDIAVSTNLP